MLKEYWSRIPFVLMHAGLLSLCAFYLLRSFLTLRRERRALQIFQRNLELDAGSDSLSDGNQQLNILRLAISKSPDASLIRQLRAIVGTTSVGGDFDGVKVVEQINGSISATDDIVRFSINGLVIVGLMGTLYAFYQMWQARGTGNVTALSSNLYLQSMSTALVISFVGLILALFTNLVFSILKTRRQVFLNSVATVLLPIGTLFPTESKTNLLLTNLLTPLNRLVEQITLQNEQVLQGLIDAVNNRTEQLNKLIGEATENWQSTIKEFKTETLSATGNLQLASKNLAESSTKVAGTMAEVSQSLERTKDIGKIVDKLEATSQLIVGGITAKLNEATGTWTKAISDSTAEYQKALERQTEAISKMRQELRYDVLADFDLVIKQAVATVDAFKTNMAESSEKMSSNLLSGLSDLHAEYRKSTETVSSDWMTEMRSTHDQAVKSMEGIVAEWKLTLENTSATVQTSLVDARDLMKETTEKIKSVNENLLALQTITASLSEQVGAPVNLSEAVRELGKTNESLNILATDLQGREVFTQLNTALGINSGELRGLKERLDGLEVIGNGNKDLVQEMQALWTALANVAARLERIGKP